MNARIRKRCLLSLFALLAASLAPALALADEAIAKAAAATAPCPASPPVVTQLQSEPNAGLLAAGAATLWFTYGTTLVAVAAIPLDPTQPSYHALARSPSGGKVTSAAIGWLALPVAGPFLTAATLPKLDPKGPMDDRAFRSILIADGALQATGVGLLVLSGLTAKTGFAKVPRIRHPEDPCEAGYAAAAKRDADKGPEDQRLIPVAIGGFMLVLFHPLAEIFSVTQSHDRARLWALIPGPGPIIAAATLDTRKVHEQHGEHDRALYGILGVTELASLGLMASAPLWKHPGATALPAVKVGAGSASLTWKF
jgi:hypothetical protein